MVIAALVVFAALLAAWLLAPAERRQRATITEMPALELVAEGAAG